MRDKRKQRRIQRLRKEDGSERVLDITTRNPLGKTLVDYVPGLVIRGLGKLFLDTQEGLMA